MYLSIIGYYSSMKRKKALEYKISSLREGMQRNPAEWVSQAQNCHSLTVSREEWLQGSQCYTFSAQVALKSFASP